MVAQVFDTSGHNWTGGGANLTHCRTDHQHDLHSEFQDAILPDDDPRHRWDGDVPVADGEAAEQLSRSVHTPTSASTVLVVGLAQGHGSFSGANDPASITMGGPITETASFTRNATPTRLLLRTDTNSTPTATPTFK